MKKRPADADHTVPAVPWARGMQYEELLTL